MIARAGDAKTRRRLGIVLALLAALIVDSRPLRAQNGALFLLVPFGARAVGRGESVSADTTLGAEGLWWNAAALSRLPSKEVAFHHSQTIIANSEMLTVAVPSKVIGTLAFGAYIVDYGDQQATDNVTGGVKRSASPLLVKFDSARKPPRNFR